MRHLRGRIGRRGRLAVVVVAFVAIGVGLTTWLRPARAWDGAAKGSVASEAVIQTSPPSLSGGYSLIAGSQYEIVVTGVYSDSTSYSNALTSVVDAKGVYQVPQAGSVYAVPLVFSYMVGTPNGVNAPPGGTIVMHFTGQFPSGASPDGTGRIVVISMSILTGSPAWTVYGSNIQMQAAQGYPQAPGKSLPQGKAPRPSGH